MMHLATAVRTECNKQQRAVHNTTVVQAASFVMHCVRACLLGMLATPLCQNKTH
jgi:hypothetical protein